jgi:hypothetical protein
MAGVELRDYQEDALNRMKNGCILNGGVGSGKSRTALAYYYCLNGGEVNTSTYVRMINPSDLYIITTANKRDALEWEGELIVFNMSPDPSLNSYHNKIVIDSWNNLYKYTGITKAMFIFDEQHVSGYGAWTKEFLTIAKSNQWVLLSATPGDTWMDYMPVFVANGFYRNKTDFCNQHVIYSMYAKYPKVDRYFNEGKLIRLKKSILVTMDFQRKTIPHHESIFCNYNREEYDYVTKKRWNIYKDAPIQNASEFCLVLRHIVNTDESRKKAILDIIKLHPKAIIFYSYDYELDMLREMFDGKYPVGERNGHQHDDLPKGDKWVYLVQYNAGAEAWNCTTTDTMIFFSQSYSYRTMVQATGRIDRVNTPYTDLYYYHIKTTSKIDNAIHMALKKKKQFNEKGFAPEFDPPKKIDPQNFSIEDYCEVHNSWDNPLK